MNSKLETAIDTNAIANGIMHDLVDVDRMEKMLTCELSSSDLFRIDCAILTRLRNTTDFSRDLLEQLEAGKLEEIAPKPQKSIDNELQKIQQETIMDISMPMQQMFDDMAGFVLEALQ
jgi:hypothetical protein